VVLCFFLSGTDCDCCPTDEIYASFDKKPNNACPKYKKIRNEINPHPKEKRYSKAHRVFTNESEMDETNKTPTSESEISDVSSVSEVPVGLRFVSNSSHTSVHSDKSSIREFTDSASDLEDID
jgi:hypothetical protein